MDLKETEFYKKYIGDYAKRFYTPFEKQNIVKIVGFKIDKGEAYIEVEQDGKKCRQCNRGMSLVDGSCIQTESLGCL